MEDHEPVTATVVTAAAVAIRDDAGHVHYFYKGDIVPGGLPPAELARHREAGFLGDHDDLAAVPIVDEAAVPQITPEVVVPELEAAVHRPAQVAAKALWVDYAIASGMAADDAEASTKQDLIDRFGA